MAKRAVFTDANSSNTQVKIQGAKVRGAKVISKASAASLVGVQGPSGSRVSSVALRRDSALERTTLALQTLKRQATPELLESFASHLERAVQPVKTRPKSGEEQERADFIAELLGGETWSPSEAATLEAEAMADHFARRRELLAGALTASQVADRLGSSRQTPHDRLRSGSLLGVMDNGALRFPAWQFDGMGPDGVVEGLPEVVRALSIPVFSKIGWMVRPHSTLDGQTPLQLLQAGELGRVLQVARAVGVS